MKAKQLTTKMALIIAIIAIACSVAPCYGQKTRVKTQKKTTVKRNAQPKAVTQNAPFNFENIVKAYMDVAVNACLGKVVYGYKHLNIVGTEILDKKYHIGVTMQEVNDLLQKVGLGLLKKEDGSYKQSHPSNKYDYQEFFRYRHLYGTKNLKTADITSVSPGSPSYPQKLLVNDSTVILILRLNKWIKDWDDSDELKKYIRIAEGNKLFSKGDPYLYFHGRDNLDRLYDFLIRENFTLSDGDGINGKYGSFKATKPVFSITFGNRHGNEIEEYLIHLSVHRRYRYDGYEVGIHISEVH